MRKLRLDVDELKVESFRPQAEAGAESRGTVQGHMNTHQIRCTAICTYNCTGIPCFISAPRAC